MASDLIKRDSIRTSVALYMAENAYLNDTALDVLKMIDKWLLEAEAVDAVPVVRCRDCENFWEYTEEHKATVENADGDCAIRKWRSDDEQFCAVTKDDYCSLARRKKDAVD